MINQITIPLLFILIGILCNLIGMHLGNRISERFLMKSVGTSDLKNDLVYREVYLLIGSVFLFIGNFLPSDNGFLGIIACMFFLAIGVYQLKDLIFWLSIPLEALQKSRETRIAAIDAKDK